MLSWDFIGTFFSLLATYYYIQMDKKAWAITLIAACVNGTLYWQKGIYANSFLESFYFLNACYGWLYWYLKDKKEEQPLEQYNANQYAILTFIFLVFFIIIGHLLAHHTPSKMPYMDALTTSLSLVAQWLMCRRIITAWIIWFFVDMLFAVMYFKAHLPFHGVLMIFYTGLAITGYLRWQKIGDNHFKMAERESVPYSAS